MRGETQDLHWVISAGHETHPPYLPSLDVVAIQQHRRIGRIRRTRLRVVP